MSQYPRKPKVTRSDIWGLQRLETKKKVANERFFCEVIFADILNTKGNVWMIFLLHTNCE